MRRCSENVCRKKDGRGGGWREVREGARRGLTGNEHWEVNADSCHGLVMALDAALRNLGIILKASHQGREIKQHAHICVPNHSEE